MSANSSRILVSNIAMGTTEETLKDFFAFCGEIKAMHLYSAENGTQEAVIKFDGDSSASTACLLNNALVDNVHINIKALPAEPAAKSSPNPSQASGPERVQTGSPKEVAYGLFAGLYSVGKNIATTVVDTAKSIDEKYAVSETVGHAANTAWTATVDTVSTVDEKLKISDTTSKLYEDAKVAVGVAPTKKASPAPSGAGEKPSSPRPEGTPAGSTPLNLNAEDSAN